MSVTLAGIAERAEERTLDLVLREGHPLVVVNSPPGAGKTTLVESLGATAVQHVGLRVAVAAPRAEQTYDILRRLVSNFPSMSIQALQSARRGVPSTLAGLPGIQWVTAAQNLRRTVGVVVANVAKLATSAGDIGGGAFDLLVCDEAYQVSYHQLHPLLMLAPQVVLVGDPGQLSPLVLTPIARFEAARHRVHWPAPKELMRRFPGAPVVSLPLSRRLPQDTVDLVQPSFYRDLPFSSAVRPGERSIEFAAAGIGGPIDQALDRLTAGHTVVSVVLPARNIAGDDVDDEVAETCARVVQRLLERGAAWRGRGRLAPADVGCADAHVRSGSLIRRRLQRLGVRGTIVDTPEIWQGLQRPVMVVKHPLSGITRLSGFPLDPGRWCVMLSRHQLACVIVTRDGVGAALDGHQHDSAERPSGAENPVWAGWLAHRALWDGLERLGRTIRA